MDRLGSMAVFLQAVESGSLSAAARKRGMPLATVSRRISDLEAHLGARLVNRSSRRLTLTDAGRDYVAAAKRILELVAEAERTALGEYSAPKGDLAITAPIVFGKLHVLPVIVEFLAIHPDINVRLVQADRIANLLEDRIDLALRIGRLPDSGLVAARLGAIRRVVCASPGYFAARGKPGAPEELGAHDCITFEGLASPAVWNFVKAKAEVPVAIRSRLAVNTAEAAIAAAEAGAGVTRVLSYQVAEAISAGRLVTVLEPYEPPPWPVHLVHAGQGPLPIKLRAFLDFAAPRLQARLAQASLPFADR